jgi:hypothetical protein
MPDSEFWGTSTRTELQSPHWRGVGLRSGGRNLFRQRREASSLWRKSQIPEYLPTLLKLVGNSSRATSPRIRNASTLQPRRGGIVQVKFEAGRALPPPPPPGWFLEVLILKGLQP